MEIPRNKKYGSGRGVKPSSPATGDDGELLQRRREVDRPRHDRVAGLMYRDPPQLLRCEQVAFARRPHQNPVDRLLELGLLDLDLAGAHRHQRRLVDQVGQVSAREPRSLVSDPAQIDGP